MPYTNRMTMILQIRNVWNTTSNEEYSTVHSEPDSTIKCESFHGKDKPRNYSIQK